MTISETTLRRMRRAAAGTFVAAASGLTLAAGSAAAGDPVLPSPTTTVAPTTPETPAAPSTTTVHPDGEAVPYDPPLDVGDCPGCGLG